MFDLIIYNADGSTYWTEHFKTLLDAQNWLMKEKNQPYWDKSFTYQIIDNSPTRQDLEQLEQQKELKNQERKAQRNAIRGIKNANNVAQLKAAMIELIKYLEIGDENE